MDLKCSWKHEMASWLWRENYNYKSKKNSRSFRSSYYWACALLEWGRNAFPVWRICNNKSRSLVRGHYGGSWRCHPSKQRRVIIESDDEDELFDPPHGESRTGSKSNIWWSSEHLLLLLFLSSGSSLTGFLSLSTEQTSSFMTTVKLHSPTESRWKASTKLWDSGDDFDSSQFPYVLLLLLTPPPSPNPEGKTWK